MDKQKMFNEMSNGTADRVSICKRCSTETTLLFISISHCQFVCTRERNVKYKVKEKKVIAKKIKLSNSTTDCLHTSGIGWELKNVLKEDRYYHLCQTDAFCDMTLCNQYSRCETLTKYYKIQFLSVLLLRKA